jgi:methyl-accepting chemotaxis protein
MLPNIRIKAFLPILFALVVALGMAQGLSAVYSINSLHGQVGKLGERVFSSVQIGVMDRLFAEVRRNFVMLLSTSGEAERAAVLAPLKLAMAQREQAFEAYRVTLASDDMRAKFAQTEAAIDAYLDAGNGLIKLMEADNVAEGKKQMRELTRIGTEALKLFAEMNNMNKAMGDGAVAEAQDVAGSSMVRAMVMIAIAAILGIGSAVFSFRRIARPIADITGAMKALAAGDTAGEIPHGSRKDEIGDMAAAVSVFRDNAIERQRLECEAEANRTVAETERRAQEALKAKEAAEIRYAVEGLATGLNHLADGDMTYRLDTPFVGQLDVVRMNYNGSVAKLQTTLRSVGDSAKMIDAGAGEIRAATEDLSRRTEKQAASVEETAAALEQVTTSVKDCARQASAAGDMVNHTRNGAERSREVVEKAICAMTEIEKSSNEIGSIIGVIDDIAFQTNLLALNAGVEAARAGEAGKGFAVVAQEVRELAQRSASAAREIKVLVTRSGEQVRDGVDLVGKTGEALQAIISDVAEINRNVSTIAASTREQSTGLTEINSAVNQIDQGTQQNASMVEESTAATHSLAAQAAELTGLLAQFKLGSHHPADITDQTGNGLAQIASASPARSLGMRLSAAFGGR